MPYNCSNLDLGSLSDTLKTLATPHRLQIICLLLKNKSMCVCDIEEKLNIKQNLLSHHLGILKRAHILENKRDWVNQIYSINQIVFKQIQSDIKTLLNI